MRGWSRYEGSVARVPEYSGQLVGCFVSIKLPRYLVLAVFSICIGCNTANEFCPAQISYVLEKCENPFDVLQSKYDINKQCNKYGSIAWQSNKKPVVELNIESVVVSCSIIKHPLGTKLYEILGDKEAIIYYTIYLSAKISDENWLNKNTIDPNIGIQLKSSSGVVYEKKGIDVYFDKGKSNFNVS